MIKDVKANLMLPRRDWNRRGPHVPAWFRRKLKRIDPNLELQYMPPADPCAVNQGVDRRIFPHGAVVICRRLRRTRMLLKQWVWCLTDPTKPGHAPDYDALRLIKRARNFWKNGRLNAMAEDIDRSCSRVNQEKRAENRRQWVQRVGETCRKYNITKKSFGVPRVFMRPGASL